MHVFCPRFNCHIFVKLTRAKRIHMDSDSDEEHLIDAKEPAIKSHREALKLTDMLLEYSRYHGREVSSVTLMTYFKSGGFRN